ncbi:MAG: hypothetical protein JO360_12135 [Acidobacteria bacterium]|nr:hypothetical protein [Acidobacteriota bacterium]
MAELLTERIVFPGGRTALCVRAPEETDAQSLIAALDLSEPRALLILNGGTAELDAHVAASLEELFSAAARTVIEQGFTVITGATDAGIFRLFGDALEKAGTLSAPCIGVTSAGQVKPSDLEPHHTHFVLVEVEEWSESVPLMYRLAAELSRRCPSLVLFASGGEITIDEMRQNVEQGREMIVIAGSGRSSDALTAALRGEPSAVEPFKSIAREARVTVFDLAEPPAALSNLIRSRLAKRV